MQTRYDLPGDAAARFARDGLLVLEDFVPRERCDELMTRARELTADFDPSEVTAVFSSRHQSKTTNAYFLESGDKIRFFLEEGAVDTSGRLTRDKSLAINKVGHALHDLDPVFASFCRSPRLAALARDLGLRDPVLMQSMYIFKQPGIGGEVVCHQDATFLYTEPVSVVGLWFALEDATRENGCLWAIPGGHEAGLKVRFLRDGAGGVRTEVLDPSPFPMDRLVPLEVPAGTLVVLHGLLPHLSYVNTSPRSRHAFTLHVVEASATYPKDNWLVRGPEMQARGFT